CARPPAIYDGSPYYAMDYW
nr:immunoglobulin heavy chain junction region [Mus musculus]